MLEQPRQLDVRNHLTVLIDHKPIQFNYLASYTIAIKSQVRRQMEFHKQPQLMVNYEQLFLEKGIHDFICVIVRVVVTCFDKLLLVFTEATEVSPRLDWPRAIRKEQVVHSAR